MRLTEQKEQDPIIPISKKELQSRKQERQLVIFYKLSTEGWGRVQTGEIPVSNAVFHSSIVAENLSRYTRLACCDKDSVHLIVPVMGTW